jgi:hypothetical protein
MLAACSPATELASEEVLSSYAEINHLTELQKLADLPFQIQVGPKDKMPGETEGTLFNSLIAAPSTTYFPRTYTIPIGVLADKLEECVSDPGIPYKSSGDIDVPRVAPFNPGVSSLLADRVYSVLFSHRPVIEFGLKTPTISLRSGGLRGMLTERGLTVRVLRKFDGYSIERYVGYKVDFSTTLRCSCQGLFKYADNLCMDVAAVRARHGGNFSLLCCVKCSKYYYTYSVFEGCAYDTGEIRFRFVLEPIGPIEAVSRRVGVVMDVGPVFLKVGSHRLDIKPYCMSIVSTMTFDGGGQWHDYITRCYEKPFMVTLTHDVISKRGESCTASSNQHLVSYNNGVTSSFVAAFYVRRIEPYTGNVSMAYSNVPNCAEVLSRLLAIRDMSGIEMSTLSMDRRALRDTIRCKASHVGVVHNSWWFKSRDGIGVLTNYCMKNVSFSMLNDIYDSKRLGLSLPESVMPFVLAIYKCLACSMSLGVPPKDHSSMAEFWDMDIGSQCNCLKYVGYSSSKRDANIVN